MDLLGGGLRNVDPNFDRAGERDLIHARVADEQLPRFSPGTGDDIQGAGGKTTLERDLSELERRQRRLDRWLQDDRAASGERWRDSASRDLQRIVPGNDLRRNADRLTHRVIEEPRPQRDRLAHDLVGDAGEELEVSGGSLHICARLAEGLAGVPTLEDRKLFRTLLQSRRDRIHDPSALARCDAAPRRRPQGRPRSRDRPVDAFGPRLSDRRNDLAIRGVMDLDDRTCPRDALSADHQTFRIDDPGGHQSSAVDPAVHRTQCAKVRGGSVDQSEAVLVGAIDMHVHSAPDLRPRKLDDWDLVERAVAVGMAGVVLKNHFSPTADRAQIIRSKFPGLSVVGSIVLNESVGGLNRSAVDVALKLGAKVVWMPTISAMHHLERAGGVGRAQGLRVARGGRLVPEMADILQLIAATGAVLATGHLSPDETAILVPEARRAGVRNIVVTHPASYLVGMPIDEQVLLARQGAFIELAFVTTRQKIPVRIEDFVATARAVRTEAVVMTSDLGQPENPYPADGLRELIREMRSQGVSDTDLRVMLQQNPAQLLGMRT